MGRMLAEVISEAERPCSLVVAIERAESSLLGADVGELLPRAEFAQVAGSGHFIQLDAPDQLVAMIRRFVDRL